MPYSYRLVPAFIICSLLQWVLSDLEAGEWSQKKAYQDCVSCHESEFQQWQKSDHAKAMAIADEPSILADFNNVTVTHYGQKATFFRDDSRFMATIAYGDKSESFAIKYSFGYYPLQQYLVETAPGKYQVLPFSWDSRAKEEGGQRWYHNYANEEIRPDDRLHWRQPLQNWNGMCADCHSDGLVRNYDKEENVFNTQFDNINVGCRSCHGDMTSHSSGHKAVKKTKGNNSATQVTKSAGHWQLGIAEKTAKWTGKPRDNNFMETCFACHSLRSPLVDGISANTPYLDQFTPQVLLSPLYHADGQISEEVYVYGSFLQSKMYAAGVNCTDCHQQHSMKLKVAGNGLCLQCHGAEVYNVQQHHHHPVNSSGALCTSCHMPDKRYMGVDDRRDHSFKIPRPDVSSAFGTPDVCVECHKGRTGKWAAKQLQNWFGEPDKLSSTLHYYYQLQGGSVINPEQHLAIIADESLSVILRATALQLLNRSVNNIQGSDLSPYLAHPEALLRLSAAMSANLIPQPERVTFLEPLLNDKYRAVRIAAVRNLMNVPLTAEQQKSFDHAYKELSLAMEVNSWRGEGRANYAVMEIDKGNWDEAEKSFLAAIKIDPYFESGYVNLAELYRQQAKTGLEKQLFDKALISFPESSQLNYSYGLYLVRQKQYQKATLHFQLAVTYAPTVEQYAYTYILSLDGEGKTVQAMEKLREIIHRYGEARQLNELGQYLYQKLNGR